MASGRTIETLKKDVEAMKHIINDLVQENYELKRLLEDAVRERYTDGKSVLTS